jgi:hypothetical protein
VITFAFHFHSGERLSAFMRLSVAAALEAPIYLGGTGIAINTGAALQLSAAS